MPDTNSAASTAEKTGGLSFIQPRATKRTVKARAPRRGFNIFRYILPLGGLVVLAAVIIWPIAKPNRLAKDVIKNIPDLVVDNLHYTGMDSDNEPYSLNAVKATRPQGVQNIYDMEKPDAEMTLKTGAWVAVKAQYGRYDQDNRKLWLGGDVQVFHDKGYQFTSDETQVDLNENYAWGDKPVLIQGDFGEIRGQGFRLLDGGHIMIVKGPGTAHLTLGGGKGPVSPAVSPSPAAAKP